MPIKTKENDSSPIGSREWAKVIFLIFLLGAITLFLLDHIEIRTKEKIDDAFHLYYYIRNMVVVTIGAIALLFLSLLWLQDKKARQERFLLGKIQEKEKWFRGILESTVDGIVITDEAGVIESLNLAAERIFGYRREELIGKNIAGLMPEPYSSEHPEHIRKYLETGKAKIIGYGREVLGKRKDGSVFPLDLAVSEMKADNRLCFIGLMRDITERKELDEKLARHRRALQTVSASNQIIIRQKEEASLLTAMCRVAVEIGGYRMAWVGFAEEDENKSVRPMAWAGFEEDYLETLNATWGDTERGRGPVGRAIRSGRPSVSIDIARDPGFAPWREEALKRGYASVISLPLTTDDRTFGALTIYSGEKEWFDDEEIRLMEELASDLSFGITGLRNVRSLQESEEKYRQLFSAESDAVIIFDAETKQCVEANDSALNLYGYGREELLQLKAWEISAEPEKTRQSFQDVADGKIKGIALRYHRKKDGTGFPVEISAGIFMAKDRKMVVATVRDITERMRAEEEEKKLRHDIENREALIRSVIENIQDALVTVDETSAIQMFSPMAEREFGYSASEVVGENIQTLMPESYHKAHEEGFSRYLRTGETRILGTVMEVEGKRKDGSIFPLDLAVTEIRLGEKRLFLGSIRNVTERKKAEEAQKRSQKLLLRSEKLSSIGTLSAGVAHEILNPLNIIGIMVQMELKKEQPAETMERLEKIKVQIGRATRIANALREFSHQKEDEITSVNIHQIFDKTTALIEHDLNVENITIERNYDENLPEIEADEDKLAQVFLNLMNNAKDAMSGGRDNKITLQTKLRKNGKIEIRLSDTGPGIPEEIIGKIFDPFFTTKEPGKGTGMGLSTLHTIIENAGGAIHVESKRGEGATFIIQLPIQSPQRENNAK